MSGTATFKSLRLLRIVRVIQNLTMFLLLDTFKEFLFIVKVAQRTLFTTSWSVACFSLLAFLTSLIILQQLVNVMENNNVRQVSELGIEGLDKRFDTVLLSFQTHFKLALGLVSSDDMQFLLVPISTFSSTSIFGAPWSYGPVIRKHHRRRLC